MPMLEKTKTVGIGQQKLYCGRKHKLGLNCQAVFDARGQFLDISITYEGASSDLLSFENSTLFKHLESGALAKDFLLFDDNAYLNTSFMATPYPNINGDQKDNFNFYHSQLQIRIECAFGMFVQRWGIVPIAMPNDIMIKKTIALVNALAKLNNFCIYTNDGNITDSNVDEVLYEDLVNKEEYNSGFVPFFLNVEVRDVLDVDVDTPEALVGGGEHFDGIPCSCHHSRDDHRRKPS